MKTRTLKKVGVGTNYSLTDIARDKLQAWIILRSDPIKSVILGLVQKVMAWFQVSAPLLR